MSLLKIKICGMREKDNILSISALDPEFLGFIFYEGSKRYVGSIDAESIHVPQKIQKVGVFVNNSSNYIKDIVDQWKLDMVQLHGNENPEQCMELKKAGLKIIKAFSVDDNFDFKVLEDYQECVDYFLFDTKGKEFGGNGIAFNWDILKKYDLEIPFFLSGGIELQHIVALKTLKHKSLFALDLNSRFEMEPGLKDRNKLNNFLEKLNAQNE